MVGDAALEREAAGGPGHEAALEVVGVVSARAERIRGERGAGTHVAVEDERARAVERVGLPGQLGERHMARAGDPARLELVRLPYVYELHARESISQLAWRQRVHELAG